MVLTAVERLAAEHAAARDAALVGEDARRRAHGIVHTPPELARAVLRVSDALLRSELGLREGLHQPELLLLDPACGPGAFLAAALSLEPGRALRAAGFDIDPAALELAASLTRAVETPADVGRVELRAADVLSGDALLQRAAAHRGPLLVVGNPPWATARARPTAADQARLAAFRRDVAGEPLAERKLGVLSDAYVRFFALCGELIREREDGALLALVTNGSFLDGPVHRGMRARLLEWFDALYVLDLGGSALLGRRRELRDDNVFGVRPSVAVSWLCKRPRRSLRPAPRALYARLRGSREQKLSQLAAASLDTLGFEPLAPEAPGLLFVPRRARAARYASYPSLPDWLPFHREGVQSNRDAVVVDADRERLLARLRAFACGSALPELEQATRRLAHYDPARARQQLAAALERDPDGARGELLRRLAYRPFDVRWFCPVTPLCHRPRPELLRALGHGAGALISVRKDRGDLPWAHAAYSGEVVDNCFLSARSSCRARAFPLYTPDGEENVSPALRTQLVAACGELPGVQALHGYLLGVLSARAYCERWDSELHLDYPRVPLPPHADAFRELAALGQRMAALHATPLPAAAEVALVRRGERPHALQLSAADGGVLLDGALLVPLAPEVLDAAVGHHRPVQACLAAGSGDARLRALGQRMSELLALSEQADAAVRSYFAATWRQ